MDLSSVFQPVLTTLPSQSPSRHKFLDKQASYRPPSAMPRDGKCPRKPIKRPTSTDKNIKRRIRSTNKSSLLIKPSQSDRLAE